MARVGLLVLFSLVSLSAVATDEQPPLRGYSPESARVEREWETKFRAIPSPQKLRAYNQRLSARPHHLGSPYDKQNAEWIPRLPLR
ncbi:MAG: hypothetical protein M1482_14295 [Chloroflexi bacterium]|nr:hypothetical protein [Chloroflexota bacterium]